MNKKNLIEKGDVVYPMYNTIIRMVGIGWAFNFSRDSSSAKVPRHTKITLAGIPGRIYFALPYNRM